MNDKIVKYVIVTKNRLTQYGTYGGELSDELSDAFFLETRKEAEEELQKYDEPDLYQIYEAVTVVRDL